MLKFTVVGLCILLIIVIAVSYYKNEEGFYQVEVNWCMNNCDVVNDVCTPKVAGTDCSNCKVVLNNSGGKCVSKIPVGSPSTGATTGATTGGATGGATAGATTGGATTGATGATGATTGAGATGTPSTTLRDGDTVTCTKGGVSGKKYRYKNNKLRLYPTADIAQSWDPNFMNPIISDCSTMTFGSDMDRKDANNPNIENPMTNRQYNPITKKINHDPLPPPISDSLPVSKYDIPIFPQRNDISPQVTLSDTGYTAMELNQRSDLIKNIQKMVKNELLADRATQHANRGQMDYSGQSASTMQGREYSRHSRKSDCDNDNSDNSDDSDDMGNGKHCPDMSGYIKKDSIPCWGCSLDY